MGVATIREEAVDCVDFDALEEEARATLSAPSFAFCATGADDEITALNGLLLIGWSASFTYLVMEQFWPLHGSHAWRRFREARSRPPGEAGEAD